MKKGWNWAVTVCLAAAVLLLSGCRWIPTTDLQDRAIVQGVAVDWDQGEYAVTMQVFMPEGSGGQTVVDPSRENAQILTCRGKSIVQAIAESAKAQGKEFYLGHNRIVILGGGLWGKPLQEVLSYFGNSPDSRMDVTMLMTPGWAGEILDVGISQMLSPAMSIENTVRNAEKNGLSEEVLLVDVLQALASPHRATAIPVILPVEGENSEERDLKAVELTGMALFSGERCEGELSGEELRGFLFLRDASEGIHYPVETLELKGATVELFWCRDRIVPVLEEGKLSFRLEIRGQGALIEKFLREGAALSAEGMEKLEKAVEEQIAADCRAAWEKSVTKLHCDCFRLGDRVRQKWPERWESWKESWNDRLSEAEFFCDVKINVDRTGLEE